MRSTFAAKLNNEKGSSLVFVLVTLVLVAMFLGTLATLFSVNLSQSKSQEERLKAHYLSQAGIDLCFAALIQEGIGGETDTLLYDEFSVDTHPDIATTVPLEDTLSLDSGDVELLVSAFEKDGERWVEIRATATLDVSGISKTTALQFHVSNPLVQFSSENN